MPSGPIRVLLLEDNAGDAELLREQLLTQVKPIEFEHVERLEHALKALEQARETVLIDLNVPDSSGLETVHRVKAAAGTAPLVVISGSLDEATRQGALDAGAAEIVDKSQISSPSMWRTIRYLAERSLHQTRHRELESVLEAMPDAILVLGLGGEIYYINRAALELFGRRRDDFLGELLTFSIRDRTPTEITVVRRGEPRTCEVHLSQLQWKGAPAILASIRDVTEKRRLEGQLLISDRMVSLGTLAAGMAHEINNPLAAVIGNLELTMEELDGLMRNDSLPETVAEGLRDAHEGARRIEQIIKDLKVFSRHGTEQFEPVDVHLAIESTLRMARNEIRHRAQVFTDFGAVPHVIANQSRLGQALLNLVVNAAQAIPEGHRDENQIRIATRCEDDGRVAIEISDTGAGIPLDVQKKLFTPFFTTKPVGLGTGLGLAICHRIITSFQGEITFDSRIGIGTTFTIRLMPAVEARDASQSMLRMKRQEPEHPRVLVVDDELLFLNLVQRTLEPHFSVTLLSDPTAVLEAVHTHDFDVIVCDMVMPVLSGIDVYNQLAALGTGVEERIVFVSAGVVSRKTSEFLESVGNPRVEKPIDWPNLLELITSLIGERRAREEAKEGAELDMDAELLQLSNV